VDDHLIGLLVNPFTVSTSVGLFHWNTRQKSVKINAQSSEN